MWATIMSVASSFNSEQLQLICLAILRSTAKTVQIKVAM